MTIDKYTIDERFEITGHWWLPETPQHTVAGKLKYSVSELCLELSGDLGHFDERSVLAIGGECRIPIIHGQSKDRHCCTLFNNLRTRHDYNIPSGPAATAYSSIRLLVGVHATEPFEFDSIKLCSDLLDDFVWRQSYAIDPPEAVDDSFRVTISPATERAFSVPSANMDVVLMSGCAVSERGKHLDIRTTEHFSIEPVAPQSIDWFLDRVWHLGHLLALLADRFFAPRQLILRVGNERASLVYPHTRVEKGKSGSLLLFQLAHLLDDFPAILEKWFLLEGMHLTSVNLMMHAHRSDSSASDARFLILAQAVETFSRAEGHAEYVCESAYKPIADAIIKAVPMSVETDHRESLKNRIKYGNEYSLRKRIRLLLDSLSPDAQEIICQKPARFVNGVTNTRNYLTHRTTELNRKALKGVDLYWSCERLLMLMRFLLIKKVGVKETLACERIQENPTLGQYISIYRQFTECVD